MDKPSKTILVSPLEWGLGHSARLVPLIHACLKRDWKVVIAADGKALDFLRSIFPDLPWFVLPFAKIKYSKNDNFIRKLVPQLPGLFMAIRKNQKLIPEIVKKYQIDAIIGDHRYGLYHPGIPSVFITNQLWLIAPHRWEFAEKLIYKLHLKSVRKFSSWWLVDFPGTPNFTGKQTHLPDHHKQSRFIGPISRFTGQTNIQTTVSKGPGILIILSGPEPQRSILEDKVAAILLKSDKEVIILRALPPSAESPIPVAKIEKNIQWMDHANDITLMALIKSAEKIICRPGLSMLSDLAAMGRTALLVPTPGQTEQNYMANRLAHQEYFSIVNQKELSLEAINSFEPDKNKPFPRTDLRALNNALDDLFSS